MHNEKDDRIINGSSLNDTSTTINSEGEMTKITETSEKEQLSVFGTFKFALKLIWNKNILYLILFEGSFRILTSFNATASIYLLDEMKYDQMKFSLITGLIFPFEIFTSFYISKYVYENPFKFLYYVQYFGIGLDLIFTNLILANYEMINSHSQGSIDIISILIFILMLGSTIVGTISFSCGIALMNKLCDKDNGGTHITIFTSLSNAVKTIPIFYCYRVIDRFGMFIPTFIGSITTIGILILVKPLMETLERTKREDWIPKSKQKYEKVM